MLQSSTIKFLKDLKKNNNKGWFDSHREAYDSAKKDYIDFIQLVIDRHAKTDQTIGSLKAKECVFRINRDIRFSKDKTPYKTNLGASINRGGKKSIFSGYYFHCEPGGKSFAGGGLWMPMPPDLKKVRQEIDYCYPEFTKIITSAAFTKQYPGLEMNEGSKLVNVPKGYDKDNPAAAFLKLKSFVATRDIPDSLLTNAGLLTEVGRAFKALWPLVTFMNRAME